MKLQIEDRDKLEMKLQSMEENLKLTNSVLSRTQALLLTERNNSQQLALHIDLLKVEKMFFKIFDSKIFIFNFNRNNMKWIGKG